LTSDLDQGHSDWDVVRTRTRAYDLQYPWRPGVRYSVFFPFASGFCSSLEMVVGKTTSQLTQSVSSSEEGASSSSSYLFSENNIQSHLEGCQRSFKGQMAGSNQVRYPVVGFRLSLRRRRRQRPPSQPRRGGSTTGDYLPQPNTDPTNSGAQPERREGKGLQNASHTFHLDSCGRP